ncbi:MAG: acyl--CoA ligase [Alphaproteobacteria bacterium]|nr:acyl--CoA ligase [Alphaproteobacteria bacterium]
MPLSGPPLEAPLTLTEILTPGLAGKPDEVALVSAERGWTWRELDAAATRLAANYLAHGLRPGDRLASLMPNRTWLVIHYLACIRAGLVATPLNYRYMAPEIDHALGLSGASALVVHAERDDDIAKSELAGTLPLGLITYGATDGRGPDLADMVEREPVETSLPRPGLDDPAFIFFTSGSTGKPKGVTHTHETFAWLLAGAVAASGLGASDTILPGSSFSHIGGSSFSLAALSVAARVLVPRTSDGDELIPLLDIHRPTVLCMLPAALFTLVRDHNAHEREFSSLRLCLSGGDKVSDQLEKEFTELVGFPIEELYGMTEIGLATANPPTAADKTGSIGALNAGFSLSNRDDAGNEVAAGSEGRLWIKSKSNMAGYWDNTEATVETVRDGWLDTGDVVVVDDDGYLWFHGRKKQIIIHDGSNICPQEVEGALIEHEAVLEAGVVGIHDAVHGENVRAYITLSDEVARPAAIELIRFARERVGFKAPEDVIVLKEMPLNATGKVDRVTLKRMAEEQSHDIA